MTTRKPTYRLKILNKETSAKNNDAGAAWVNKDGSISLVVNPGVVLREDPALVYTLFTTNEAS